MKLASGFLVVLCGVLAVVCAEVADGEQAESSASNLAILHRDKRGLLLAKKALIGGAVLGGGALLAKKALLVGGAKLAGAGLVGAGLGAALYKAKKGYGHGGYGGGYHGGYGGGYHGGYSGGYGHAYHSGGWSGSRDYQSPTHYAPGWNNGW